MEGIPVIDLVGDAGVKVTEIRPSSVIVAVGWKHVQDPVRVSSAASDYERSPALGQRTFEVEATGQETEPERTFNLVGVALASTDIQDRRDAPAEFRGNGTFVELYLADDVGVESREYTEQMCGIVKGSVVEKDKILVG